MDRVQLIRFRFLLIGIGIIGMLLMNSLMGGMIDMEKPFPRAGSTLLEEIHQNGRVNTQTVEAGILHPDVILLIISMVVFRHMAQMRTSIVWKALQNLLRLTFTPD